MWHGRLCRTYWMMTRTLLPCTWAARLRQGKLQPRALTLAGMRPRMHPKMMSCWWQKLWCIPVGPIHHLSCFRNEVVRCSKLLIFSSSTVQSEEPAQRQGQGPQQRVAIASDRTVSAPPPSFGTQVPSNAAKPTQYHNVLSEFRHTRICAMPLMVLHRNRNQQSCLVHHQPQLPSSPLVSR